MKIPLSLWALAALQTLRGAEAYSGASLPTSLSREALTELSWVGKRPSHPAHEVELVQAQQTPPARGGKTTHKSWFERLGDAFASVLIGFFVIIPFSISLLWMNESRSAQLDAVINAGESEAETIEGSQMASPEYDGALVHLSSESARGLEPVQDQRFPAVKMESGCIKLRTTVEVYQWQEEKHEETRKDSVGGGETTYITYTYDKAWCSGKVDSSSFDESSTHRNTVHVTGMSFGVQDAVNSLVKYGEAYTLPAGLVSQLNNFTNAEELVGDEVSFGGYGFAKQQGTSDTTKGDRYHCPAHDGSPEIGDVRVQFEHVLDGPATILALQIPDKGSSERTFGPYRSVPTGDGCCGSKPEDEVRRLRIEATEKTADDFYEENKCPTWGCFGCLCACCNLVNYLFAAVAPPQIYSAWPGQRSKDDCLDAEEDAAAMKKWGIRVVGWVLLWIGVNMLFAPLSVIADIIPFIGPYLGSGISFMLAVFTFLVTIAIASLIISLAYLVYRPLWGILAMMVSISVVGLIVVLGNHSPASGSAHPHYA